jgi:hypothetical protein
MVLEGLCFSVVIALLFSTTRHNTITKAIRVFAEERE